METTQAVCRCRLRDGSPRLHPAHIGLVPGPYGEGSRRPDYLRLITRTWLVLVALCNVGAVEIQAVSVSKGREKLIQRSFPRLWYADDLAN
ncbi:hypothetical protein K523DRAFT_319412 [Schizophyllum commune Tattone D]|nr:hypothetical protein K523DRAFT_319412 [Schizophyllum commune Tattone D]